MLLRNKNILCIGGFDPSGAAGVLADGKMISFLGAHASALITLDTCQSRHDFVQSQATALSWLQVQWRTLHQDLPVHAVKLGAIANTAQAQWLGLALADLQCPIVLDPVLNSSSGGALSTQTALRSLAPRVSVLTPNRQEAADLFGVDPQRPCWTAACPAPLLVTGADHARAQGETRITHRLLTASGSTDFQVPLRPGRFRGSGCLLGSALACALADGASLPEACERALHNVDAWLQSAWAFADAVHLPQRPA